MVGVRASRGLLVGMVATALALPSRSAQARGKDGPTQITPDKVRGKERRKARREAVDRSDGGARQGVLELSLGSVVLGGSALLIGRGAWELSQAQRLVDACRAGTSSSLECFAPFDPKRDAAIAAGLSFGISGVLGLAGGFLLVRGVRIRRDYLKWKRESSTARVRLSVQPWAAVRQRSGGLTLRLRF